MPIPDFQTLMRPLLQHLSDGAISGRPALPGRQSRTEQSSPGDRPGPERVCPGKLFTGSSSLIVQEIGQLNTEIKRNPKSSRII